MADKMSRAEKRAIRKATSKAGKASAAKLTDKELKERAQRAAHVRWDKAKERGGETRR